MLASQIKEGCVKTLKITSGKTNLLQMTNENYQNLYNDSIFRVESKKKVCQVSRLYH